MQGRIVKIVICNPKLKSSWMLHSDISKRAPFSLLESQNFRAKNKELYKQFNTVTSHFMSMESVAPQK